MKTYRRHNCSANHRTYLTFAKCSLRWFAWVQGEGEYASISWCRAKTAMLFETYEDAKTANDLATRVRCGHGCSGRHEVVKLSK